MKRQPRSSPRSARTQRTVSIIGTGSYLPEKILTNEDLSKLVDTSDEWITSRTGIRERRMAAPDEHTSDMAAKAALKAIEQAGREPLEADRHFVERPLQPGGDTVGHARADHCLDYSRWRAPRRPVWEARLERHLHVVVQRLSSSLSA